VDREALARLQARYARRAEPIGLTAEELDFGHYPASTTVPGIPVRAWIRFPSSAELVDGEVFTWTAKAAQVVWFDGPLRRATWVWAGAVTRRGDPLAGSRLGDRTAGRRTSGQKRPGEGTPRQGTEGEA
jgi:hypothetical protein